jgi:hypothetical protein
MPIPLLFELIKTGGPRTTPLNRGKKRVSARRIRFFATQSPALLDQRIQKLDREISAEKMVGRFSLLIYFLTAFLLLQKPRRGLRWTIVALVTALFQFHFTAYHKGFWRLFANRHRYRVASEINAEKLALKTLRGDFFVVHGTAEERAKKCIDIYLDS